MREFRVIDLDSQAQEVAKYIKGWKTSDVLAWLRQYGDLTIGCRGHPNSYLFHSHAGVTTGFIIEQGGLLTIIGDHTTRSIVIGK